MTPTTSLTAPAQKTLALGFLGLGWIGRNRMEVLLKNANTKAMVIREPRQENILRAMESARDAMIADTPEQVYREESLDGIVIATPSAMHAGQSIKALQSGKAVFCQKPLGRTAAEVKKIVAASLKADRLLSVDLSYRYTKAVQAIHRSIRNNDAGHIYAVNLTFHNAYGPGKPWFYDVEKSGGGCVMDLGIHLVDLALWNLGFPEITRLESHLFRNGRKLRYPQKQVEDFANVTMFSEDDTMISLECSWNLAAGRDAVIEAVFYGTKASVAFKNVDGSFYDFKAEKYTGTRTEVLVAPPDTWSGRAGIVWAEAIRSGQGFDSISAREYIKVAEIIDRIYGK